MAKQLTASNLPAWYAAKPGDVWLLTVDGEDMTAIVDEDGDFELHTRGGVDLGEYICFGVPLDLARITAGERIHPRKEQK